MEILRSFRFNSIPASYCTPLYPPLRCLSVRRYFSQAFRFPRLLSFNWIPPQDLECEKVRQHTWHRASIWCRNRIIVQQTLVRNLQAPETVTSHHQRVRTSYRGSTIPRRRFRPSLLILSPDFWAPRSATISTLSSHPDQTPDGTRSMAGWPVMVSYPWRNLYFPRTLSLMEAFSLSRCLTMTYGLP